MYMTQRKGIQYIEYPVYITEMLKDPQADTKAKQMQYTYYNCFYMLI